MKSVIFENIEGTEKIIFDISSDWEDYKVILKFEPAIEKQNPESTHSIMASTFFQALKK